MARVTRPSKGLLGGMVALPTGEWRSLPFTNVEARVTAPAVGDWRRIGEVEHVFTHFALTLQVWRAEVVGDIAGASWTPVAQASAGLPSVFLKVLKAAEMAGGGKDR